MKTADYSVGRKVVHWLMAAFMLDLVVAQKFGGLMTELNRFESRLCQVARFAPGRTNRITWPPLTSTLLGYEAGMTGKPVCVRR
jgi:hypothetical protein